MARRTFAWVAPRRRRFVAWSSSTPVTSGTSLAASTSVISEVFTPTVPEQTVVRIRGLFAFRGDNSGADENQIGAVGIIMVKEPAATLGITAVPTPATDGEMEWMWHSYFTTRLEFSSGVGFDPNMYHQVVIDSKAMRKMGDDDRLCLVVENSAPFGMEFTSMIRILSKLS